VPALGVAAAVGLVLYFVGALAHLRVGSRQLIGWAVFFTVAVAALAVNLCGIAATSGEPFAPPGTTNRAWTGPHRRACDS
jgi:hypothetical protein